MYLVIYYLWAYLFELFSSRLIKSLCGPVDDNQATSVISHNNSKHFVAFWPVGLPYIILVITLLNLKIVWHEAWTPLPCMLLTQKLRFAASHVINFYQDDYHAVQTWVTLLRNMSSTFYFFILEGRTLQDRAPSLHKRRKINNNEKNYYLPTF